MATSKTKSNEKTTGKAKKNAAASKTVKTKTANVVKQVPTEDEIRSKAQEIYNARISLGEHATPEEDWLQAEKLLKGNKR
jgi:hypothetical protein